MRVPQEIFDDVKKFMERRKQQYLAEQEGISLSEEDLPHSAAYSLPQGASKEEMSELIKEAIREELSQSSSKISSGDVVEVPPASLTSQERVKQLLMQRPGEVLTTLQIGEILNMPNSTAREATRSIADDVEEITKKPGRPNKFVYTPTA